MSEPGWKRNGRNGPLDWWLGCNEHGDKWVASCMSCGIAIDHNIDFKEKLERERSPSCSAAPSAAPSGSQEKRHG
jgi:hypothetical protein